MDIKIKIFWIVSILTGIIFIYMLSNIIFKLKLRKKDRKKINIKDYKHYNWGIFNIFVFYNF